jgi:hypothetical protein
MFEDPTRAKYETMLRQDFTTFAARCFYDLNPQTDLAVNWHLEVIAAKLAAVRQGKIRRLIINKAYEIDNIAFIFHPAVRGRSVAFPLSTRVEYHATLRRDDLDAAIISSEASAKGDPGDRTNVSTATGCAAISPGFDSQIAPRRRGDKSRVRPRAMKCQGRDTRSDRSAIF